MPFDIVAMEENQVVIEANSAVEFIYIILNGSVIC